MQKVTVSELVKVHRDREGTRSTTAAKCSEDVARWCWNTDLYLALNRVTTDCESDGDYPEGEEDRPQGREGSSSEAEGIVLGDGNIGDDGDDDEDDGPPGLMPKQIT